MRIREYLFTLMEPNNPGVILPNSTAAKFIKWWIMVTLNEIYTYMDPAL